MPRPPRAKVALSATRVAKPIAKPTTRSQPVARKQEAKATSTKSKKASVSVTSFSEDSDGLVVKSKSSRPRRRMPWQKTPEPISEADLTMTGALPVEEDVPAPAIKTRTPAPSLSKRPRTTRGSATKNATQATPAQTPLAQTQPAVEGAPAVESAPEDDASPEGYSGYGDLTFSSLGSESPAHGTRPPSAIKVGATPAHEQSILALTNFKRRARQPSLLRMVQQTTDVEDNDQDDDDLDNTDNFDFDDFLPEAESTPLNVRRNAQEEDRNDSGTQISSSGSRGVKRKLSPVVQVPRSSPPFSPPSGADLESRRSTSPSLPDVLPSREAHVEQTQEQQELLSQTLAPPMSSSPIREITEPPQSPVRTRPARKARDRPAKALVMSDDSEAEETETPVKSKRGAKKTQKNISTAQLKDLLPRRRNRQRNRDEFDLDSSDEVTRVESDQDELQMPHRRQRQRPGAAKATSPKVTKKSARGKKAAPTKPAQKASRTYSRRVTSDKENEAAGQEDEAVDESSVIEHSEKLEAIRKKFEEVDAFELEFDTADVTTSSSPFR